MSSDPALTHHAALDARLVVAVRPIRMLEAVSWPAQAQESFLAAWRDGHLRMPKITYPRFDFHQVRAELDAVHRAADPDHPLGHYLQQTSESWRIATRLLDVLGSHRVTAYSTRLFGRSGEHTSELQSLMRISYAVFCLTKIKYRVSLHSIVALC